MPFTYSNQAIFRRRCSLRTDWRKAPHLGLGRSGLESEVPVPVIGTLEASWLCCHLEKVMRSGWKMSNQYATIPSDEPSTSAVYDAKAG